MRFEHGKRAITIVEENEAMFDEKLNKFLQDVSGEPIIQFHNIVGKFGVTVIGKIEKYVAETKADEYQLRGEEHYCCECKYCKEKLAPSGKADKRFKWRDCTHSEQPVCDSSPACDFFYIMLEAGESIFKNEEN